MGRELTLKRALRDLRRSYDLIVIDCPPALGLLTVNALVAADHALISTEAEYFSLQGVEQALEVIELAKESLHPDLDWLGVVLNIADMRLVHAREAQMQLKERFGEKVFDTVVRRSVRYAESAERGVSILDYAPDLGADYVALAERDPGPAGRRLRRGARPAGDADAGLSEVPAGPPPVLERLAGQPDRAKPCPPQPAVPQPVALEGGARRVRGSPVQLHHEARVASIRSRPHSPRSRHWSAGSSSPYRSIRPQEPVLQRRPRPVRCGPSDGRQQFPAAPAWVASTTALREVRSKQASVLRLRHRPP